MVNLIRRLPAKRSRHHALSGKTVGDLIPPDALDPTFYRECYPDLGEMSDEVIVDHWRDHGVLEGRLPNARVLPTDFRAYDYVAANPDLLPTCADAASAVRHYLAHGASEGRSYRIGVEDGGFIDAFQACYGRGAVVTDARLRWVPTNVESYLRYAGFGNTGFLTDFDVPYYAAAVGLEGNSRSLAACLFHFVEEGVYALQPIALSLIFDPVFFRDRLRRRRTDEGERRDDVDLYREWLDAGSDRPPGTLTAFTLAVFGVACTIDNIVSLETYRFANKDLADKDPEGLISHLLQDGLFEQRSSIRITRGNVVALTRYADRLAGTGQTERAETLYRRLQHFVPDHAPLNEHLGNILLDGGRYHEALIHYQRNIASGPAGPWTFHNAAVCCQKLHDYAGSLAVLAKGSRDHAGDHRMSLAFEAAADQFFADEFTLARADAMAHRIPAAHARLAEAAERCTVQPCSAAPTGPIRTVALFANMDLSQCTLYRVEQKVEQLSAAGYGVKLYDWMRDERAFARDMAACDAVIFYRVAAFPPVIRAILAARVAGLHVFYEVDDLIFDAAEFPDSFESYAGQISWSEYVDVALGVPLFRHAMSLCDYAIASTPALARRMEPLVRRRRAFVHRNGLGRRHLAAMAAAPPRPTAPDAPVTIFYGSGTKAHKDDFQTILLPALEEIERRFGERVRIVIAGHPSADMRSDLRARLRFEPFVSDVERYWAIAAGADIALSVLRRTPATDAKSEIKWLEGAMFAAPSVTSPTETFADVLVDGQDGFLAADEAGFVDALSTLVSDAARRRSVGDLARRKALALYAPEVLSRNLSALLAAVETSRTTAIRVLVVNVFYPPQSIGGATRVVVDNIRNLRTHYGDTFAFEVFTTLDGGTEAHTTTVTAHDGVRVTAMTASSRADVDSTPHDAAAGEVFRQCVERFAPDLVHFHCIQRITASAVAVVRTMEIPYLITVHDGWWICDRQFLYDNEGLVEPYDFSDPYRFRQRVSGVAFDRPAVLRPALEGAAAILAVSEPFAAIYRGTGLRNVRTVANGLPDGIVYEAVRQPRPPGAPVRIGHVGGLEPHKGFPLLKRAFEVARPRNLSLLAVDLAMPTGEVREEIWGTVAVTFVARRPQSAVMTLYADIDVLFAPSLWPESFGLVTREALAAGCWVVASNRGAIAEPIEEGVNGHIVDVDDLSGLLAVLRAIDADPERYARPPRATVLPRTSLDQAHDLAVLYREIADRPSNGARLPSPDRVFAPSPECPAD